MQRYGVPINAPRFPAGATWLNTDRPLAWADLRGKVVVLDFWTAGCINCLHVLPDLKRLEDTYGDALVVIGVHSGKFAHERDPEAIQQAIQREAIEHPVINDPDLRLWSEYAVRAWPTLVLVDPLGKIVGMRSGEGAYAPFHQAIGDLIARFDARGLIDRRPLDGRGTRAAGAEPVLAFPGKVLADEAGDRLFIADTNHHRIVVTTLDGAVQTVYGGGQPALRDGPATDASFRYPQGLALVDATLYVADTGNHAVRAVDLADGRVWTVAGTGTQSGVLPQPGPGASTPLNSPWDLVALAGRLYVAMAGSHQVWRIDPTSGWAAPFAGAGHEALTDGPLATAAFAQPSGITSDGAYLYVADSESSSLRTIDPAPPGTVRTIVGQGLFAFGNVDGVGDDVRLQHPLGITWHAGRLYVVDTYNHTLRVIEPAGRVVATLAGDGRPGRADGAGRAVRFNEPGGVSGAGDRLYISDTSNHLIRVVDLTTAAVRTLALTNLARLPAPAPAGRPGRVVTLSPLTLAPGMVTLTVDVLPAPGQALTADALVSLTLVADGVAGAVHATRCRPADLPAHLQTTIALGTTDLTLDLAAVSCHTSDAAVCRLERVRLVAPLVVAPDGRRTAAITYTIAAPASDDRAGDG